VVLATGPVYTPLAAKVAEGAQVVNILEVMAGKVEVGENVVIWGNRKPGIGCALHLSKLGKKVTLVGREKSAGFDVNPSFKWRYMIYLRQHGIMAYNDCALEEVNQGEVIVKTYDGYRFPLKCDTVVLSERAGNEALKKVVLAEGLEHFVIGDALVPRNLSSAVHDGYRVGLRI
jgi:pyruvate/2-oxoglutarate dehydrogenase complex dihydrolipoamide dehydrogenase (E3) component